MASIKIIQPKLGSISILGYNPLRLSWTGPSNAVFSNFSLYCEACCRTLKSTGSNPGSFNTSSLEESGHPGPYDITANVYELDPGGGGGGGTVKDDTVYQIRVRTDTNDERMGTTTPNMGYYGVVASKKNSTQGIMVNLVATPALGCKFLKWEDEYGNTISTRQSTTKYLANMGAIVRDYNYIAYFTDKCSLILSVDQAGGGTVTPFVGSNEYNAGAVISVAAIPDDGYRFLKWSDGGDQNHDITMDGDKSAVAYFESLDAVYRVTVHVKSSPTASVYQDSFYTIHGQGLYKYGDVVEVSVEDRGEKRFVKWEDENTDNPRTVVVTSDITLVAIMDGPNSINVKIRINQTGTDPRSAGRMSGRVYRILGSNKYDWTNTDHSVPFDGVTLEAVPSGKTGGADGPTYRFIRWEDGSTNPLRTLRFPTEGQRVVAYFGNDRIFYDNENSLIVHGENDKIVYSG